MAKKAKKNQEQGPVCTPDEEMLARTVVVRARIHGSAGLSNPRLSQEDKKKLFFSSYGAAARDLHFGGYEDLPRSVRSFIGKIGGWGNARKQREIDTTQGQLPFDAGTQ